MEDKLIDMYSLLSGLLIPENRENSLKNLKIHSHDSYEFFYKTLEERCYSSRTCTIPLTDVCINLKRYLLMHDFNARSPRQKLRVLQSRYLKNLHKVRPNASFSGKSVLDLGAGTFNPITTGVLLRLMGASDVLAYELAPLNKRFIRESVEALINYILFDNQVAEDKEFSRKVLTDFIYSFDVSTLYSGQGKVSEGIYLYSGSKLNFSEYKQRFDYILSTSVLEHISDLEEELLDLHRMLKPDGLAIHIVDLSDHRFISDSPLHDFINNAELETTINGYRMYELINIFEKVGLKFSVISWSQANLTQEDWLALRKKYPDAPPGESLAATSATFAIYSTA